MNIGGTTTVGEPIGIQRAITHCEDLCRDLL